MRRAIDGSVLAIVLLWLTWLMPACNRGGADAPGAAAQEKQKAIDTWIRKDGAAVRSQADHLRAIFAKAAAVPSPVSDTRVDAPDLLFHSSSALRDQQVAGANAKVVMLPDLAEPEGCIKTNRLCLPGGSTAYIHNPAFVESRKEFPPSYPQDSMSLETDLKILEAETAVLLSLKYVVVLRQTEHTPPVVSGKLFSSGTYRADALVYRIADEALVGTVRVGVKNSPAVSTTYRLRKGSNAKADVEADLEDGIRPVTVANVLKAMK